MKIAFPVLAGLPLALALLVEPRVTIAQVPSSAIPVHTSSANDVMPEYIEDFFLSEAVRNEDRGELQVTATGMVSRNRQSAADGSSAGLDFEYGLSDRLQLAVELPYGIHSTHTSEIPNGWSTVSTGLLYQFIRRSHPFALSAGAGAQIPVNGHGEIAFEPEVIVARQFGVTQVHASVEPEIGGDDKSLAYNVAAVRPWPHYFYPTLEFNGRRNDGINSFYVTPGLYRRLPHRLEFGVGVPVGASNRSSPIGVVFNMTWEVGGDKDQDD